MSVSEDRVYMTRICPAASTIRLFQLVELAFLGVRLLPQLHGGEVFMAANIGSVMRQ